MRAGVGLCALFALLRFEPAPAATYWVTVAGLGGEAEYEQRFSDEAAELDKLLKAGGVDMHVYTLKGAAATRAGLRQVLAEVAGAASAADQFVLVLIGHGTYDGVGYKFNLPGPDLSATELAALCDAVPAADQLIVNTTSASGSSVSALQRRGRAVIAATKGGTEKNATVFARYWIEALQDPAADLDKSDSISALEAFEYAARKSAEFYATEKRLATEHAVFEDTGAGAAVRTPTPDGSSSSNEGRLLAHLILVRFGEREGGAPDAHKHDLLATKESLQQQIDELKYQKAAMPEADYASQLKSLLLQLARTQAALDQPLDK
jgi:hypothetical protein